MCISAFELGQWWIGGHNHNDILSFEFNKNWVDFIIDPWTYCYTSDIKQRNYFRSTKAHNTISVNNLEQNSFINWYLFALKNEADVKVNELRSDNDIDFIDIEHNWYLKKAWIIHRRIFEFYKKSWEFNIKDILKWNWIHNLEFNIQLDSEVSITLSWNESVLTKNNIKIKLIFDKKWNSEIIKREISYAYWSKIVASTLKLYWNFEIDNEISFEMNINYK